MQRIQRPSTNQTSPTLQGEPALSAQQAAVQTRPSTAQTGLDAIAGPAPVTLDPGVGRAKASETIRWNALARGLVAKTKTPPPMASRAYSVLSEVQFEALSAAKGSKTKVSAERVLQHASAAALTALFPGEAEAIAAELKQSAPKGRTVVGGGSTTVAKKLGEEIAASIVARRADDGHANKIGVEQPAAGPGVWVSAANPPAAPLLPHWGTLRPVAMPPLGDARRPVCPPPPAHGSAAHKKALAEVRQISDTRTPEQLAIGERWAAGAGTMTPPGQWNEIAAGLIAKHKLGELDAARVMHAMNAAVMDAGIACWEVKYQHWTARPSMDDPAIKVPPTVGLPNFPSYTSGHATFSGAAARVLGHFFPSESKALDAMAVEAAMSRVYAGIHFRYDGENGLEHGRKVADFALSAIAQRGE